MVLGITGRQENREIPTVKGWQGGCEKIEIKFDCGSPLPRWGEGNRDRLILLHLQGDGWDTQQHLRCLPPFVGRILRRVA